MVCKFRKLCFVLCVMFLCLQVSALEPRVRLGNGNDKWSYGQSHNEDDRLTFDFIFDAEYDNNLFQIDLSAFTNRGDYFGGNVLYEGRYDELKILYNRLHEFLLRDRLVMTFRPYVGFVFAGNLGLENIQNRNHTDKGIPVLNLPYENLSLFRPEIGAYGDIGYTFVSDNLTVEISAFSEAQVAPGYMYYSNFGVSWDVCSLGNDILDMFLQYDYYNPLTDVRTQKHAYDKSNGLQFGFILDSGLFEIDALMGKEYGYTTFAFDIMAFFRPENFKHADFYMTESFSRFMGTTYGMTSFEYEIARGFSFFFSDRFFAGSYNFKDESRIFGRLTSAIAGASYNFPDEWSAGWVTPYISLSAGLGSYDIINLDNGGQDYIRQESVNYVPVVELTAGIKVIPLGFIVTDYTSYRLTVSYSAMAFIINYDKVKSVSSSASGIYVPKRFESSVSIGLSMAFDSQ